MNLLKKYGLRVPELLLPNDSINLEKWAVIACDQYTQDTEYWKKVCEIAKDVPSTLHMILPEIYLNDSEKMIEFILEVHGNMQTYIDTGIFKTQNSFMYIERKTAFNRTRKGLLVEIDLETYDWKPFSNNLIRSTEETIVDRIPPRVAIRKKAPLESPHIMLLVNDPDKLLVEKTGTLVNNNNPQYDTNLMMNGGHITGWEVSSNEALENITNALEKIAATNTEHDGSIFMFAAGDGNHSLATAKEVWEQAKPTCKDIENAPERFALVEIVNIFDDGLTFEPIHRVVFNIEPQKIIDTLKSNWNVSLQDYETFEELDNYVEKNPSSFGLAHTVEGKTIFTCISTDKHGLLVSYLQPLLDELVEKSSNAEIDYIHGSEEVCRLAKKENAVTFFMPPIEKDAFFATIADNGPLPRKSFSMGEADEKRFYLECRKLFC